MPRVMSQTSRTRGAKRPKIGLILGAGGVLGGAWLVGALHAIATESGWDPGSADYIVGTSAGSMIGALLACGTPPWFMVAHSAGEDFDGFTDGNGDSRAWEDRSVGATYRLDRGGLTLGPGSWRLAMASLARPYRYSPTAMVSGWLPRGFVSTEPLKETVRRVNPGGGWAPHPNFWPMAVDYGTGRLVAFGARAPRWPSCRTRRGLVRDPRVLSRGRDRRALLHRRGRALDVEPRRPVRRAGRCRRRAQPDVITARQLAPHGR